MGEQIEEKIVVIKEEICIEEKTVNIYLQEESVKKENIELKGNSVKCQNTAIMKCNVAKQIVLPNT